MPTVYIHNIITLIYFSKTYTYNFKQLEVIILPYFQGPTFVVKWHQWQYSITMSAHTGYGSATRLNRSIFNIFIFILPSLCTYHAWLAYSARLFLIGCRRTCKTANQSFHIKLYLEATHRPWRARVSFHPQPSTRIKYKIWWVIQV